MSATRCTLGCSWQSRVRLPLFRSRETLLYAGFFDLAAHGFVIFYEEPALRRQFGSTYDHYYQTVPRWNFVSTAPAHC